MIRALRGTPASPWIRVTAWVGVVALAAGACTSAEPPAPDRLQQLFDGAIEVVDLTHALSADSPYWPGGAGNPFAHRVLAAHADGTAIMGAYSTPEHHGTHIDAPTHGGEGLATVDQLSSRELWGPAIVVDVSVACASDADYVLTVADLERWEQQHGRIPRGAVVLMATGWSRKYGDHEAYANQDADGAMHFPGFSAAAAEFLVRERDIRGIGIDTLSVDAAAADGFPAHGAVNGSGRYHLENLANLHVVPATGAYLIVAPIKIEGGSGGQVRVYAVLADSS